MLPDYPQTSRERDYWILARRSPRPKLDPHRPLDFHVEEERAESGDVVNGAVIFLTNKECPWHCLMCDLWRHTLEKTVPRGAIPTQIDFALAQLQETRAATIPDGSKRPTRSKPNDPPLLHQVKLYNSGSFFDPGAIPPEDYQAIAWRLTGFARVIVECHPALVTDKMLPFRDMLPAKLEVAMGLETVHPQVLDKLNKRMTLELFSRAAEFLRAQNIALRVFVLVRPPFLNESEGLEWAKRSLDFAFDCGASVVSLIPTRFGNGALEALARVGQFAPPRLETLEAACAHGVATQRARVFADLWGLEKFASCGPCFPQRYLRLREMNHTQQVPPPVSCPSCARP